MVPCPPLVDALTVADSASGHKKSPPTHECWVGGDGVGRLVVMAGAPTCAGSRGAGGAPRAAPPGGPPPPDDCGGGVLRARVLNFFIDMVGPWSRLRTPHQADGNCVPT